MNNIGLKDYFKNKNYFKDKEYRNLKYELKRAFQRFWRGYDDIEVFDFGFQEPKRLQIILQDFKNNNIGLWNLTDAIDYSGTLSKTESDILEQMTNAVLQSMINNAITANLEDNEDTCLRLEEVYKDDKQGYYDACKEIALKATKAREELFFEIAKYINQMWY